jgi:hypothetical protein
MLSQRGRIGMRTYVAEVDGEAILAFRAEDDDAAERIICEEDGGLQIVVRGYSGLLRADDSRSVIGTDAVSAQQDDLSPPDVLMRRAAIPRERSQVAAVSGLESDGNSRSRPPDSHVTTPPGIPAGIQMSGLIH